MHINIVTDTIYIIIIITNDTGESVYLEETLILDYRKSKKDI